jgi:hypothetical protein
MRSHNLYLTLMLAAFMAISGCGDESDKPGMFLSGTYSIDDAGQSENSPVLVALTRSIDNDLLENNPRRTAVMSSASMLKKTRFPRPSV